MVTFSSGTFIHHFIIIIIIIVIIILMGYSSIGWQQVGIRMMGQMDHDREGDSCVPLAG